MKKIVAALLLFVVIAGCANQQTNQPPSDNEIDGNQSEVQAGTTVAGPELPQTEAPSIAPEVIAPEPEPNAADVATELNDLMTAFEEVKTDLQ